MAVDSLYYIRNDLYTFLLSITDDEIVCHEIFLK